MLSGYNIRYRWYISQEEEDVSCRNVLSFIPSDCHPESPACSLQSSKGQAVQIAASQPQAIGDDDGGENLQTDASL